MDILRLSELPTKTAFLGTFFNIHTWQIFEKQILISNFIIVSTNCKQETCHHLLILWLCLLWDTKEKNLKSVLVALFHLITMIYDWRFPASKLSQISSYHLLIIFPSSELFTTESMRQWVELENWISPIHEQIIQITSVSKINQLIKYLCFFFLESDISCKLKTFIALKFLL